MKLFEFNLEASRRCRYLRDVVYGLCAAFTQRAHEFDAGDILPTSSASKIQSISPSRATRPASEPPATTPGRTQTTAEEGAPPEIALGGSYGNRSQTGK